METAQQEPIAPTVKITTLVIGLLCCRSDLLCHERKLLAQDQ